MTDASICGIFYGLFRNFNMHTKQLSTYVYWRWQYIKSLLGPQLYNGNLILKYFSSGAVNFISASAKIRGIFPCQWSTKLMQSIGKTRNVLILMLSIFTIKYLLLFALRLVCFRQAGECPFPIYWETREDSKKMQCLKIPKTPLKMEFQSLL